MASSPRPTRWIVTAGVFLLFAVLAIGVTWLLRLTGMDRVSLVGGLLVLGLIGAGLAWHVLRPTDGTPADDRDDALLALRQASARLGRGAMLRKPVILLVGPPTAAKTTIVAHSGLDAQLLAGDARGSGVEEPTTSANAWLARDAVLVEAAGALAYDGARFTRFVRALRAPGLAAALGRGEPAPRSLVLCVPCDYLIGPDQGTSLDTLALHLRERLADAARELGLHVPVYVLFTRADRLPFFESWSAPLTRDELRVPLGAAVPAPPAAGAVHAEWLTPALESAFASLVGALAARRSELLLREPVEQRRLAAYETPRELGKLAPAAVKFLVEITRPVQLGRSPQLRGFWFTGIRPTLVRDADAPADEVAAAVPVQRGATMVLSQAAMERMKGPPRPPREVPEWVFLERFFHDVVLNDESARTAAIGGARVSGLRRALLGGTIGVAAALGLGVTVSWLGNRAIARRTIDAARAVAALPSTQSAPGVVALPSINALRTLDRLRLLLDTLAHADSTRKPLSLGFGLWRGDALYTSARQVWAAGYRRQLHDEAWRTLTDSLRALPAEPVATSDYGHSYDMLRTYLVGTTEHARSAPPFVAPVLLSAWARGTTPDSAVATLATHQFEAYAKLQAAAPLWNTAADANLVGHVRRHLGRFAGTDPIYLSMRTAVASQVPPLRLTEAVPQAAGLMTIAAPIVDAPFTADGWRAMQAILNDADRFFQGETWVVGDQSAVAGRDRTQDLAAIRAAYQRDYIARWRAALKSVTVLTPGSAKDAANRLARLSSPQSPLLAVLALASRNTNVDSVVARAFQPLHEVTPPGVKDRFVSEANEPYVNALLALQPVMENVASLPPGTDTASVQTLKDAALAAQNQASMAKGADRQLALKFSSDPEATQVGSTVTSLLEAPIDGAIAVLRRYAALKPPRVAVAPQRPAAGGGAPPAPAAAAAPAGGGGGASGAELAVLLNNRGKDLCKSMDRVLDRFPFNPDGGDARYDDITQLLAPVTGSLWQLYDDRLQPLLSRQGGQYVARTAGDVTLNPQFVAFFNRMARASNALFADRGSAPRMTLSVQATGGEDVSMVTLVHGEQTARFGRSAPPAALSWPANGKASARVLVTAGGREREIAKADGPWALFRLVGRAASVTESGTSVRATFTNGSPVTLEFSSPGVAASALRRGALAGAPCTPQLTR